MATICDKCNAQTPARKVGATVMLRPDLDPGAVLQPDFPMSPSMMPGQYMEPKVLCEPCTADLLAFLGIETTAAKNGLTPEELEQLGINKGYTGQPKVGDLVAYYDPSLPSTPIDGSVPSVPCIVTKVYDVTEMLGMLDLETIAMEDFHPIQVGNSGFSADDIRPDRKPGTKYTGVSQRFARDGTDFRIGWVFLE